MNETAPDETGQRAQTRAFGLSVFMVCDGLLIFSALFMILTQRSYQEDWPDVEGVGRVGIGLPVAGWVCIALAALFHARLRSKGAETGAGRAILLVAASAALFGATCAQAATLPRSFYATSILVPTVLLAVHLLAAAALLGTRALQGARAPKETPLLGNYLIFLAGAVGMVVVPTFLL